MTPRSWVVPVLCVSMLSVASIGQVAVSPGSDPNTPLYNVRPGKLDAGDVVRVRIYGLFSPADPDDLDVRIDAEGEVNLPHVGAVLVKGMQTDRAATAVSGALSRANLMQDGVVTIGILKSAADARVKLGPIAGDENLRITIFNIVGPGERLTVHAMTAEDGMVHLPTIGPIKVVGLTEAEASDAIKRLMNQKNIDTDGAVVVLRLDPSGLP